MNAQRQKLELIEWLVRVQDIDILGKVFNLKKQAEIKTQSAKIKPMSIEQFNKMIDLAEADAKAGKATDMDVLETEMKNW